MQYNSNFSYWEQQSFIHYDFVVIGAGIVGLFTAIELKTKFPKASVAIVERGFLPTGASTKNAGFACMGSVTELLHDIDEYGEATMLELFAMRKNGLQHTRELLGDAAIGYQENGSYEMLGNKELYALQEIEKLNALLQPIVGKNAFEIHPSIIANNKFDANFFEAAIQNNCEGEINTGMLLKSILQYALQIGIEIKTGCEITALEQETNGMKIFCTVNAQSYFLKANKVAICTNAFAQQLLPAVNIVPGRGQVLITKEIKDLPFKGIYHFDEGYYYFRAIHNRVLFGGGRNLDFETEATTAFDTNEKILARLKDILSNHILPNQSFEIDSVWSGIMAFGESKKPIVQQIHPGLYCAVRCGGMGVAIGNQIAKQVVDLMV
jgi:gamma-glutamylputrescine oxidase